VRIGFDTGFFVRLMERDQHATAAWQSIRSGAAVGLVSCLTLYELHRLGLRGTVPRPVAEGLTAQLPLTCAVIWLDRLETLDRAAHVAHGSGLSMADSLIVVSLADAGARTIFTTDSDLARYTGGPEIRRL